VIRTQSTLEGEVAVSGADGVQHVLNYGDIYGAAITAGGDDVFTNGAGGIWHVTNHSTDFGDGDDSIQNQLGGTIELAFHGAIHLGDSGSAGNAFVNEGILRVKGRGLVDMGTSGSAANLLPLENNGKTIDLDLIQNIQRLPYNQRFRLILNDLGAGLAGRGQDLGEVIDRANPALRQTDRVLAILAQQNQQLASLASNGDAVLKPLADNRTHITGFFHNAAIAGQATAERSPALEEGLRKFPATLHQVRLTMTKLKSFADQGTPLFTDLNRAAPGLSKATINLPSFARLGIPALTSLGNAAQTAGPKLAASDGLLTDLAATASSSVPVGTNFSALLDTFEKTQGFQSLMNFIYNTTGSVNGFDSYGHFQRSNLQLSTCVEIVATPAGGCEAFFGANGGGTTGTTTKKKKKKASAKVHSNSPIPPVNVPNLQQLIPQLVPPDATRPNDSGSGSGSSTGSDSGTTTTTPDSQSQQGGQQTGDQTVSMRQASMFLQFLLGGGA
jgi:hypothetical protein